MCSSWLSNTRSISLLPDSGIIPQHNPIHSCSSSKNLDVMDDPQIAEGKGKSCFVPARIILLTLLSASGSPDRWSGTTRWHTSRSRRVRFLRQTYSTRDTRSDLRKHVPARPVLLLPIGEGQWSGMSRAHLGPRVASCSWEAKADIMCPFQCRSWWIPGNIWFWIAGNFIEIVFQLDYIKEKITTH